MTRFSCSGSSERVWQAYGQRAQASGASPSPGPERQLGWLPHLCGLQRSVDGGRLQVSGSDHASQPVHCHVVTGAHWWDGGWADEAEGQGHSVCEDHDQPWCGWHPPQSCLCSCAGELVTVDVGDIRHDTVYIPVQVNSLLWIWMTSTMNKPPHPPALTTQPPAISATPHMAILIYSAFQAHSATQVCPGIRQNQFLFKMGHNPFDLERSSAYKHPKTHPFAC